MRQAQSKYWKTAGSMILIVLLVATLAGVIINSLRTPPPRALPSTYQYDIESLKEVDLSLITYYESAPPIPTGFAITTCIATAPDGTLVVGGDQAIRQFDHAGSTLADISLPAIPQAVVVDNDGVLYIALKDRVLKQSPGTAATDWGTPLPPDSYLTGIALSEDSVYIADAGNRIVYRIDKQGTLVNEIGRKDERRGISGFKIPSPFFDIAVADDGMIMVANTGRHRLERYTPEGHFGGAIGSASMDINGFCGCCNPAAFALRSDGGIITAEKGIFRIKHILPDGSLSGVVADSATLLGKGRDAPQSPPRNQVYRVATGVDDTVFVLDPIQNSIRTFTLAEDASL